MILPFDEPEKMEAWYCLEALVFFLDKQMENRGFQLLCERFGWNISGRNISEKEINVKKIEFIKKIYV